MFYPLAWLSAAADLASPPPRPVDPVEQSAARLGAAQLTSVGQVNGPALAAPPQRATFSPPTRGVAVAMLRQGHQGEAVKQLQTRLQHLTYDPGPIDGRFGLHTDQAVRQFQAATGLSVDGVAGPATWTELQRASAPTAKAPPSSPLLPRFSPAVPQLQFHPIARLPNGSDGQGLVLLVIGLAGVGVTAYGFRPDHPKPTAQLPIHYPQPVYPQRSAAVHQPHPIYPSPGPTPPNLFTCPAPSPACLPEFVYDLQQPQQRQALEASLQAGNGSPPALAALLNRLGTFPVGHHRTGQPYTYLLLDDLGGCFRLCNNELWVTQAALQWLRQDTSYSLTIRRLDGSGRVEDREFTVALGARELALAA